MTPNLTDAQIAAEMGRLGITNQQGSAITGVPVREIESRINATSGTLPFANATQAFAQDFNNYTSIPIGAQYNPAVVGGTGSPYSQIMAQMRPVGNPYAGALQGLPMGGYDPGIYDAGLLDRVVAEREAKMDAQTKAALAARNAAELSGQGGDALVVMTVMTARAMLLLPQQRPRAAVQAQQAGPAAQALARVAALAWAAITKAA
jgi:hypothetical protein